MYKLLLNYVLYPFLDLEKVTYAFNTFVFTNVIPCFLASTLKNKTEVEQRI